MHCWIQSVAVLQILIMSQYFHHGVSQLSWRCSCSKLLFSCLSSNNSLRVFCLCKTQYCQDSRMKWWGFGGQRSGAQWPWWNIVMWTQYFWHFFLSKVRIMEKEGHDISDVQLWGDNVVVLFEKLMITWYSWDFFLFIDTQILHIKLYINIYLFIIFCFHLRRLTLFWWNKQHFIFIFPKIKIKHNLYNP